MSMLTLVLCVLLLLLVALQVWRMLQRPYTNVPGPAPLPIIGNVLDCRNPRQAFQSLLKYRAKYGNIFRVYMGSKLYVVISEPRDIERVVGNSKILDRGEYISKIIRSVIGDGLLSNKGERWRRHRRVVSHAFHQQVLDQFVEVFNEKSTALAKKLSTLSGQKIDLLKEMATFTLSVSCDTILGSSRMENANPSVVSNFLNSFIQAIKIVQMRLVQPWLQTDSLYSLTPMSRIQGKVNKVIMSFLESVSKQKITDFNDQSNSKSTAFQKFRASMDIIAGHSDFSPDEIKEEVYTLIVSTFESVATSLSYTISLLRLNQVWQDAIKQEVDQVFGVDDIDRPVTASDLKRLKVTERVIKESLRLYPPVAILPRQLESNIQLGDNEFMVPKDSLVLAFIYFTHRLPNIFHEPEKFDPDRFLPDNIENISAYVGFGTGLRACIGSKYAMMLMKTTLANLFRRLVVTDGLSQEDLQDLELSAITHPSKSFFSVFQKRE